MWQRFTERARKVVFYAQEEAQKFGEGFVSTEHLLLGLCRESDSVAARVLEQLGISLNRIRVEIEKHLPVADKEPSQDMTLTPRCKRVIDLAYDEARNLNNNYIGTEHLILGLIREGDGLAGRVLAKLGAELERARREVMRIQEESGVVQAPLEPPTPPAPAKPPREYAWSSYDEAAQRAFVLADEMAKSTGDTQVAPYHLICALLSEPDSSAAQTLRQAGVEPDALRDAVERHRAWAEGAPPIWVSPNTRKAIGATYDETNSLQSDSIGPEHLLLGLAMGNADGAGRLLADLGVSPAKLRQAVLKMKDESP
jgi:ATP-dependent Clp protease ATP-binding subunit ClpA